MNSRRWLTGGLALLLIWSASACNYKAHFQRSAQDYSSRTHHDPKMRSVRSYGSTTRNPKQHDNRYFDYDSKLSYKVSTIPGVSSAIVMVTDKNAYAAILTDWSATGTKARGGPRTKEQDNTGTTDGVYNNDTGSPRWSYRKAATPYNSYFSHKDPSDISSELKQVIGETIRRTSGQKYAEVHISANQEFVNQLLEFAKADWGHRPLEPLLPEFNKLVKYIFAGGNEVPVPLYELGAEGT
ncbi:hypothetical protein [Cohnella algarum]|uniref:hypothetical protein n=1 Tax=Cohnella algarum TaxID=2044859 RepID=UPI001967B8F6|nr:hypothetical protein [Cohnella algarum]MBN2982003.1 hypothetical protein [Cohnella algarum]